VALLALLLPLTGCREDLLPRARDITRVELMQALALDEGKEGKLRVTAASGVRSGGQGGEPRPPVILTREAPTVLAACMDMQGSASGYASFSHVEQVVLSAGAAQRSTAGLLDFLGRDPEMRLDAHIYITQGKASEVVEKVKKEERSAAELLEALSREMEVRSQAWPVTVRELLIDLEENGCALLPVLEVKEEGGQSVLACETMGWFQEDDFRQALPTEEARGAALLKGELGSGVVETKLPEGSRVGLRLTRSRCKWVPQWRDGQMWGLTAQVEVQADVAEVQGGVNLNWPEDQKQLRCRLEQTLQKELEAVLERSQKEGGDFLHLQREARVLCPARYRDIDENWEQWFPELELRAQVRGTVERSYDLNRGGTV
jgi:spore germination protein KC